MPYEYYEIPITPDRWKNVRPKIKTGGILLGLAAVAIGSAAYLYNEQKDYSPIEPVSPLPTTEPNVNPLQEES